MCNICKDMGLNIMGLVGNKDELENRCFMCREKIDSSNYSEEHIFPKWLLNKYDMFNQRLTLPNKTKIPYRMLKLKCCKNCNCNRMSEMENKIKSSIDDYSKLINIDEEIIVWWLLKIYYAKIYKETTMRVDLSVVNSKKIIESEFFEKYDSIFVYMSVLFKEIKFENPRPYELYIFRTSDEDTFDYIDDLQTNTMYLRINNILIVCIFNSFGFIGQFNKREIAALKSLDKIHPIQGLELFAKFVYFRFTYFCKSGYRYKLEATDCKLTTEILEFFEFKKYKGEELHFIMKNTLQLRGVHVSTTYVEGEMFSFIFGANNCVKTSEQIERELIPFNNDC